MRRTTIMNPQEVKRTTCKDAQEAFMNHFKRPTSNKWAKRRTWAAINYLIAMGNRASTSFEGSHKIRDDLDA